MLVAHAGGPVPDVRDDFVAAGFSVVGHAGDGLEAVELAVRLRPDVVVVDAALPRLDGISVTGRITGQGTAPVVVVMTASDADRVDQAIDAGAMACLVEPHPSSVVAAADMVLARQADNVSLLAATLEAKLRDGHGEVIDRAKSLLMTHLRLTEDAAARWLHRTAVEGRTTMHRVAGIVIDFWSHRPVVSRPTVPRSMVHPRPALYCC